MTHIINLIWKKNTNIMDICKNIFKLERLLIDDCWLMIHAETFNRQPAPCDNLMTSQIICFLEIMTTNLLIENTNNYRTRITRCRNPKILETGSLTLRTTNYPTRWDFQEIWNMKPIKQIQLYSSILQSTTLVHDEVVKRTSTFIC